jgi:uncharacterized protein (DUF2344 family)
LGGSSQAVADGVKVMPQCFIKTITMFLITETQPNKISNTYEPLFTHVKLALQERKIHKLKMLLAVSLY